MSATVIPLIVVNPDHELLHITRVKLGRSVLSTGSGGMHYGAVARCSCGWHHQVNEAPSRGGRSKAARAWRAHAAEVTS